MTRSKWVCPAAAAIVVATACSTRSWASFRSLVDSGVRVEGEETLDFALDVDGARLVVDVGFTPESGRVAWRLLDPAGATVRTGEATVAAPTAVEIEARDAASGTWKLVSTYDRFEGERRILFRATR